MLQAHACRVPCVSESHLLGYIICTDSAFCGRLQKFPEPLTQKHQGLCSWSAALPGRRRPNDYYSRPHPISPPVSPCHILSIMSTIHDENTGRPNSLHQQGEVFTHTGRILSQHLITKVLVVHHPKPLRRCRIVDRRRCLHECRVPKLSRTVSRQTLSTHRSLHSSKESPMYSGLEAANADRKVAEVGHKVRSTTGAPKNRKVLRPHGSQCFAACS